MLPSAISDRLLAIAIETRRPAFFTSDRRGCIVDFGGALDVYGLHGLKRSVSAAGQLFFLEGLLPLAENTISLPFVKTGLGPPTDIHLFRAGDVDYALFLDAETAELKQQTVQQRANEMALLGEILSRDAVHESSSANLFGALEMTVLNRAGLNDFQIVGNPPEWFVGAWPKTRKGFEFKVPEESYFLSNFLVDAEAFWKSGKPGYLKSGLWSETAASGFPLLLEAFAVRLGDRMVLLLAGPRRDLDPKKAIQMAREEHLELSAGAKRERNLEDQLRQAQKMDAVGRLANGIAHDFNNILAVILGQSESIIMFGESVEEIKKRANSIRTVVQSANRLTIQLLSFSRKRRPSPQLLDPNAVILGMEHLVVGSIGSDIITQFQLDPGISTIMLDAGQLEQVMLNLVVNAKEAMPAGGRLEVQTRNVALGPSYASTSEPVKPGRYVMLSVTDTGSGMDDDTLRRIFEPFFTTKNNGNGLGLATVCSIVRQCGGAIEVESKPGAGATFRLYFPAVESTGDLTAGLSDPGS